MQNKQSYSTDGYNQHKLKKPNDCSYPNSTSSIYMTYIANVKQNSNTQSPGSLEHDHIFNC